MTKKDSAELLPIRTLMRRRDLCLGLLALPTVAWTDDIYDDYINSTSKQPFVAFLAREASSDSVGHAFVGVGVDIEAGFRLYLRLFGLYPKDDTTLGVTKSIFTPTSGNLDYTWKDITWTTEFRKAIDSDQQNAVLSRFDQWSSSAPQYSLLANNAYNCSALAGQVAALVGLTVPAGAGSTRPWKYIEALKAAN